MRIFAFCLTVMLLFGPVPVAASQPILLAEAKEQATPQADERLEKLFSDLRRTRGEKAAEAIASKIWAEWFKSGSASIDLMMQWSNEAVKAKKYSVALDFLDQIVTLAPNFAEGWNRRATLHFVMNNYAKSMADIQKTLALEPRHFGALSGMGMILSNTGRKQLALEAYQQALAVYPMMRSAQKAVEDLSEELAGDDI